MWDCSSQKIVYSTVRVNSCLFVVEQIDGICEVGSRERGFYKRRFFFWMDSQIVLWWILQRRKEWKIWVQNRVETIRENVVVENWGFVPIPLNPANILTRECSFGKLKSCLLW